MGNIPAQFQGTRTALGKAGTALSNDFSNFGGQYDPNTREIPDQFISGSYGAIPKAPSPPMIPPTFAAGQMQPYGDVFSAGTLAGVKPKRAKGQ